MKSRENEKKIKSAMKLLFHLFRLINYLFSIFCCVMFALLGGSDRIFACRLRSVFKFCGEKKKLNEIAFWIYRRREALAETVKIVITFTLRIILISRLICTKAISFAGTLALRAQSECVEPWSSGVSCWRERVCCCLAGNRYMVIISKL